MSGIEWAWLIKLIQLISTVRTKNTITIVSQYPNRHVQIVLRLYKSISHILTGFDVNCESTCLFLVSPFSPQNTY